MQCSVRPRSVLDEGQGAAPGEAWPALAALAAALVWALPVPARADPSDAAYSAQARRATVALSDLVQEMIITARKREESAQRVPLSVTPYAARDLAARNMRKLESLDSHVPSLLVTTSTGTANSARVALRGIGQGEPTSSADPAVGVYVDGVYLSRFQGELMTLFDVDRVEVLRGPQGTLFGKNTIGGAVNLITAKPKFEFGGNAEVRFGNFDTIESRFALNVPLIPEKAAMRFSLATATRDGYTKNRVNGDEYSDNKMLGGRVQLLALPGEDLEVMLSAERTREDRKPQGSECVFLGRRGGTGGFIASHPSLGFREACLEDQRGDEFDFASDVTYAEDRLETTGTSAKVTWDVAPDLTLTSISAWRRQQTRLLADLDGTSLPLFQDQFGGGGDTQDQWSQEVQLTGRTASGRVRYVAGVFAFSERAHERDFQAGGFFVQGPDGRPLLNPDPARTDLAIGRLPFSQRRIKVDNSSLAAYGQFTWSITSQLDLTVGLRRTVERKRVQRRTGFVSCPAFADICPVGGSPVELPFFDSAARFGDWSPMLSLAYAPSRQLLFYANYSTGFRSGGFNGLATRQVDTVEVEPENLTSYEIGVKSAFFADRMRLNASGYYNIVDDLRIPFTDVGRITGLPALTQANADRVLMRGGEIELAVLPVPDLQLSADIGILRAEYARFSDAPSQLSENERLPDSPNYTMTFAAAYSRPLGRLGDLSTRLEWVHRGSNLSDFQGTDALEVSKVGLMNGRVALALPDGRTEIAVFGSNLLDRRYFDNGVSFDEAFGYALRYYAPPRLYGIELRRSF
jgi:iron complex outermembrane recepter protein